MHQIVRHTNTKGRYLKIERALNDIDIIKIPTKTPKHPTRMSGKVITFHYTISFSIYLEGRLMSRAWRKYIGKSI